MPFAITYRIDLEGGHWCSDSCETIETLALVAGQVVLRERYSAAGSNVVIVDPATGRFTDTLIEGGTATLRSGTCEPAPFTGLLGRVA